MNQSHLEFICAELLLGMSNESVTSIHGSRGGSFIWRVNTDKGSFAVKQLAPAIDLKNTKLVSKYELSEVIASRFALEGIEAVSALEKSGKHLIIIDNSGYLVYPWVQGYVSAHNEVSEVHAVKIAEVIAKLHRINLYVPEIGEPRVDQYSSDNIIEAIDKVASFKFPFAKILKENQSFILSMNDKYLAVTPFLLENTLVSHGDLDQLNIIWGEADQPILIDWESARKINPTREIVRASLVWSGVGGDNPSSLAIYNSMLRTYISSGGTLNLNHMNAAFYSSIGSMIFWMIYNIDMVCTSDVPEIRATAIKEISEVMIAMKKFNVLVADLLIVQ